jgi:tetratricopeptide (TPR) repeat protein
MAVADAQALKEEGNSHFKAVRAARWCVSREHFVDFRLFAAPHAQGDFLKAAAAFTKSLKAQDGDSDLEFRGTLLSNRSAAFARLNKAAAALKDADEALKLRPTWEKAAFRRGVALEVCFTAVA